MATLDEILAAMPDEGMTAAVTDEVLVIDPNTRQISIPSVELTFGVEGDAGSERKYFLCPRYVGDNVDLASCFIRVNYRNANGDMDEYLVNDVVVDGDNVVFSWELSGKAIKYKGQTKFVVCAIGPDTKLAWHTTQATGLVLAGLEPDNSHVTEETSDVVAQLIGMVNAQTAAVENVGEEWVADVKAEGATQVQAVKTAAKAAETASVAEIEAKGVNTLASIPDDYTALSEAVAAVERSMAPGIVCEAAGETVVVSDASNQALRGLRIFGRSTQDGTPTPDAPVEIVSVDKPVVTVAGKNLLNLPQTIEKPTSGYNYDLFTGTGGVATAIPVEKLNMLPMVKAGETYYFSYDISDHDGEPALRIIPVNKDGSIHTTNGSVSAMFENKGVFTPSMDSLITIRVGNASTMTISNIQLEYGSAATDYEPYRGGTLTVTHTLPGIPVTSDGNYTDSDGQQWVCDEVDLERGVYVQRVYDYEMTGRESWMVSGVQGSDGMTRYDGHAVAPPPINQVYAAYCTHFPAVAPGGIGAWLLYNNATSMGLRIRWPFETLDEMTAFLSDHHESGTPVVIKYPLAVPIETPLSETELAAYRVMHTNRPNTTILNDQGAHMAVAYTADTKLYIDNKIKEALQ